MAHLMHISGILTYLFYVLLSPPGEGSVTVPPPRKILIITSKLIIIMTTWKDRSITSITSK